MGVSQIRIWPISDGWLPRLLIRPVKLRIIDPTWCLFKRPIFLLFISKSRNCSEICHSQDIFLIRHSINCNLVKLIFKKEICWYFLFSLFRQAIFSLFVWMMTSDLVNLLTLLTLWLRLYEKNQWQFFKLAMFYSKNYKPFVYCNFSIF